MNVLGLKSRSVIELARCALCVALLAKSTRVLTALLLMIVLQPLAARAGDDFMAGGLINDYVACKTWGSRWRTTNPLHVMRENGFGWVATWVLTITNSYLAATAPDQWQNLPWRDGYWSCLEYSTELLRNARDAGLHLHVLLVMSDRPTWPCNQGIPPEWRGLSDADLAAALEQYCARTATHFADAGLNIGLYSLGNEIEFGILNTTPDQPSCVPPGIDLFTNLEFSRTNIWPREAFLLKAAIRGIKSVNPTARIALHPDSVGRSAGNQHLRAFVAFMVAQGVEFDYASFTHPQPDAILVEGTRPYFESAQFLDLVRYVAQLGKKVLIGEVLYPHNSSRILAPPDPGYPYTPEGQARWIRHLLEVVSTNQAIGGVFYWYPDYFPGYSGGSGLTEDFTGLFQDDSHAQPSMAEFRRLLPRLAIAFLRHDILVSWPFSAEGFVLESASSLNSTLVQWQPASPPYLTNSKGFLVVAPLSADSMFYRLRKPIGP